MKKTFLFVAMVSFFMSCKKEYNTINNPTQVIKDSSTISSKDNINGDTITFSNSHTVIYTSVATGALNFTLNFENATIGSEVFLSSPISGITSTQIVSTATPIATSNISQIESAFTHLSFKFKYLGYINGQMYYSIENFSY